MDKLLHALISVVIGVGFALVLYWLLNKLAELLPGKWEDRIKPYAFIGPSLLVLALYLIYPALQTIEYSFANADSSKFIGFQNYSELLGNAAFRQVLYNTALWIVIAPTVCVALGLLVAVLTDRLGPNGEKTAKLLIFLPMAISGAGAGAIWRFVYQSQPAGTPQIGILNEIVTKLGHAPVPWLQTSTLHLNTFLLMIVLVWGQVGYSMVLLSAAIKAVPDDTIEAGRIDGAGERAIFFRIIMPQVWGTVITVFITVLITVMKVFDIVYVTTNGGFNTDVVATRFFNELFTNNDAGHAAAIVVMLMIAVIPVLIYQVRHFRAVEANS